MEALPLVPRFILCLALAQIMAGTSRLLHDNRRTLAGVLGLIAIVLVAVFACSFWLGLSTSFNRINNIVAHDGDCKAANNRSARGHAP